MQISYVDLATGTARRETLADPSAQLGGRHLTAHLLSSSVDPRCDALSGENPLVFATGLLADLRLSGADRLSVGAKSPLTGGIKESNSGGTFARALARLGHRALVLEGEASDWTLLYLHADGSRLELLPAYDLVGLDTSETVVHLARRFPEMAAAALIGPAGERRLRSAAVAVTDGGGAPNRFAARGGLGAVMGTKKVKAIVVERSAARPAVHDPSALTELRGQYHDALRANPTTADWFPTVGTAGMMVVVNGVGGLPVCNFSRGESELADRVSGETLADLILARGGEGRTGHPCAPGCVVRCSNVFPDADGRAVVAPLEYESIGMLGTNLGIFDLDTIAQLNRVCNLEGLDTIEVGGALGVAMEAGYGTFGSGDDARRLLEEIREGTVLGMLLGNGAAVTGQVLGVRRVPVVKGQTISAYDPRAVKGTGVTFATTPMGGDHTAGLTIFAKMDHRAAAGQLEASRTSQLNRAGADALGLCSFHLAPVAGLLHQLVNAVHGTAHDETFVQDLGLRTIQTELDFNRRAGLPSTSDRLPAFFCTEGLPPHGAVFDVPVEALEGFWHED